MYNTQKAFEKIGQIVDTTNASNFEILGYKCLEMILKLYYHDAYRIVTFKFKEDDTVEVIWGEFIKWPEGSDSLERSKEWKIKYDNIEK